MRKAIILAACGILLLSVFCLFGAGFLKESNAHVLGFSLSPDGSEITLELGVSSSAGYIRKVSVHQQEGGKLYLDCYRAFGGINGCWGARSSYTIPLMEDTESIALYRAENAYAEVLEKDPNGQWQMVK